MTVAGDAGGPDGSVVVELRVGSCAMAVGGGDSDEGVPELDIVCMCVFVKMCGVSAGEEMRVGFVRSCVKENERMYRRMR